MRSSSGEKKIYDILSSSGIKFKEEYTFPDLVCRNGRHLRFDFAVFTLDGSRIAFLIEFQGEQHYKPVKFYGGQKKFNKQRYNDARKRAYCKKHRIPLVVIPYYDEPKLDLGYILEKAGLC